MQLISDILTMQTLALRRRQEGKTLGFVPTMGAFHEGHLSLMCRAKAENDLCVVSLFVNPTQFVRGEDFSRYPRNLEEDARMAEAAGVDLLFAPATSEMYPAGYVTYVEPTKLTEHLCGLSRPGHFRGVATIVLKLFQIVQPSRAYFGRKDYQQLKIIQRMVKDFHLPVEIVPMPIVRESDGLAMSSRNRYLTPEERRAALVLYNALKAARSRFDLGERDAGRLREIMKTIIQAEPRAAIDYVAVCDPETFEDLEVIPSKALAALAVKIGAARLIDNTVLGEEMTDIFATEEPR